MINETLIHAITNALKFGSALYICIYIYMLVHLLMGDDSHLL